MVLVRNEESERVLEKTENDVIDWTETFFLQFLICAWAYGLNMKIGSEWDIFQNVFMECKRSSGIDGQWTTQ